MAKKKSTRKPSIAREKAEVKSVDPFYGSSDAAVMEPATPPISMESKTPEPPSVNPDPIIEKNTILKSDKPQALMEQVQTRQLNQELSNVSKGNSTLSQLIVFRFGHEKYAVPIGMAKEVVRTPEVSVMPETASYVKGVGNIRGNIIAIFDLMERFGLGTTLKDEDGANGETKASYTLVIESSEFTVGILLDNVPDTLAINEDYIDRSPSIIQDASKNANYIKGIVKSGDEMIILIDIVSVVESEMSKIID